jgi:hypothetical protein
MTKSLLCSGLLLVGVSVIAAGCVSAAIEPRPICDFNALMAHPQSPSPAVVSAAPSPLTEMPLNSVNITDVMITNKVMVQAVNARRNPSGTLEVWTRIANCTDFPLQIEGRTHFLDQTQAPVEAESAWNRVHLAPRSYGVYRESSTRTADVHHYYVEIREGH